MTGTSQATAFVSGAAVLIKARKPAFNFSDIKRHILATGDADSGLLQKTRTSRQLNLYKCLTILDRDVSISGRVYSDSEKTANIVEKPSFGKSLLNKIKQQDKERLGRENRDGEL